MADVTITIRPNGPLLVEGPVKLIAPDGRDLAEGKERLFLCRCGQSKNKPFCDGTHKAIGFQDGAGATQG